MSRIPTSVQPAFKAYQKAQERIDRELTRDCMKVARRLLNEFQKRVKFPVEYCTINGEFWLGSDSLDKKFQYKIKELSAALDSVALDRKPSGRYEERIFDRFPEMVELWEIAYEVDSLPNRPQLPNFKPTVKPRKCATPKTSTTK